MLKINTLKKYTKFRVCCHDKVLTFINAIRLACEEEIHIHCMLRPINHPSPAKHTA